MEEKESSAGEKARKKRRSRCWSLGSLLTRISLLCGSIMSYCLLGAFLFRALETPLDLSRASKVQTMRNLTILKLWNITDQFNVLYKENWTSLVTKEMVLFQEQIINAVNEGLTNDHESADSQQLSSIQNKNQPEKWSLAKSFLFSLSIITTMGPGNQKILSDEGKLVTMFYATLGIPFMMWHIVMAGRIMAKALSSFYGSVCSCNSPSTGHDDECVKEEMIMKSHNVNYNSLSRRSQMANANAAHHHHQQQSSAMTMNSWNSPTYMTHNGHISSGQVIGGGNVSTMIDLSQNASTRLDTTACGACEYCVQEAGMMTIHDVCGSRDVQFEEDVVHGVTPGRESRSIPFDPVIDDPRIRPGILKNNHQSANEHKSITLPSKSEHGPPVPVTVCLMIIASYMLSGGWIFSKWIPQWTLTDGSFFAFLLLTTIGYGEGLTSTILKNQSLTSKKLLFTCIYLIIGYSLISMCYFLLNERIGSKLVTIRKKLTTCSCFSSKEVDAEEEDDFDRNG